MSEVSGPLAVDTAGRFADEVRRRTGQPIERCYQCAKCASGCLVAEYTDYRPNQILRMVQFGLREQVLQSRAIWVCSSCQACGARCPNGINIAAVMDGLKEMAVAEKLAVPEQGPLFHQMFMDGVRRMGRVHEAAVLARYKLKTHQLLADFGLGLRLFRKGKFPLLGSRIRRQEEIERIFSRALASGEGVTRREAVLLPGVLAGSHGKGI
ncbi:MAG: 4Fe-4S dicluster domain-containing protein [Bacillota bacterium]|nr:4Fe-4S dicluster domain-containing protein [Bacillota bacterium]